MRNYFILHLLLIIAVGMNSATAGELSTYQVDCPEDFPDCETYITSKIHEKIIQKYPVTDWKIVVPLSRFFLLGNGTLKGHFRIAIVPIANPITTKELNSYSYRGTQLKKQFSVDKYWRDIIAMGGEFSDKNRFGPVADERVYRAKKAIYVRMAEESAIAMNSECFKSESCIVYEE